jgi:hypothetical protein
MDKSGIEGYYQAHLIAQSTHPETTDYLQISILFTSRLYYLKMVLPYSTHLEIQRLLFKGKSTYLGSLYFTIRNNKSYPLNQEAKASISTASTTL